MLRMNIFIYYIENIPKYKFSHFSFKKNCILINLVHTNCAKFWKLLYKYE